MSSVFQTRNVLMVSHSKSFQKEEYIFQIFYCNCIYLQNNVMKPQLNDLTVCSWGGDGGGLSLSLFESLPCAAIIRTFLGETRRRPRGQWGQ